LSKLLAFGSVAGALWGVLLYASLGAAQTPPPLVVWQLDRPAADAALAGTAGRDNGAAERYVVGMRLERLFEDRAERILLSVGGHFWVARFEHLDRDVLGHRSWVGSIEGIANSHVSFIERSGIVSGLINALEQTYQLRTLAQGVYLIERVEITRTELDPIVAGTPLQNEAPPSPAVSAPSDRSIVDVLILYTPNARARAGGLAQMQALVAQIASDSNTIFGRSGVSLQMNLVGSYEVPIVESTDLSSTLHQVTNEPGIRSARDYFRADLVQLLVSSPTASACGVAWLLDSLAVSDFNAYSVADVDCVAQYTPTHEMMHNMGSHHAPEDDAMGALFPYSYGYKDPTHGFRTIMAYPCANARCARIPNLSNPSVAEGSAPTGTPRQNNALSVNQAAATVVNFRQRATVTAPPSAPAAPQTQVIGSTVVLSWDPVSVDVNAVPTTVDGYGVHVRSATGRIPPLFVFVGNTTSVRALAAPDTYFWNALALNNAGASPPSSEQSFSVSGSCGPTGEPQNFRFSLSGREVTLNWAPPVAGAGPFTYVVEAGSAPGLTDLATLPVAGATTLTVQAPPGTYHVRIRSQSPCGITPPSDERMIVVP